MTTQVRPAVAERLSHRLLATRSTESAYNSMLERGIEDEIM